MKRTLSTLVRKKTSQTDLVYTCNTNNQNLARSVRFISPYFLHPGIFCLAVGNKLKNYSEDIFWIWLKEGSTRLSNISDAGLDFNPTQDENGGWVKLPPISFSHATSQKEGISPQIFLTFSFNSVPHWGKTLIPLPVLNLLPVQIIEFEPRPPLKKKCFLCLKSCKSEIMVTFFLEMLMLPNFDFMYNII